MTRSSISRRTLFQLAGTGAFYRSAEGAAQKADASHDARQHIDAAWFRKALTEETEHWLKAADTPNGFFLARLDREWRPVGEQVAAYSQPRQIFVRAIGYDLTRNPAYLESLRKGTDFLLKSFRDSQYGGMFYSVSPEGKVIDDRKDGYGTAFDVRPCARGSGNARRTVWQGGPGDLGRDEEGP